MKNTLKTALTAIKRWAAYYRMRSIEIHLAGMVETYALVKCQDTRAAMRVSIKMTSKELCKARAEYQACLQPGQRIVWDFA
ncbi:MAG: hypothetical protein ACR2IJ_03575 [Fluviibacter sp.]